MFEGEPDWKGICIRQYPQEKSSLVFHFILFVDIFGWIIIVILIKDFLFLTDSGSSC